MNEIKGLSPGQKISSPRMEIPTDGTKKKPEGEPQKPDGLTGQAPHSQKTRQPRRLTQFSEALDQRDAQEANKQTNPDIQKVSVKEEIQARLQRVDTGTGLKRTQIDLEKSR